MVGVCSAVVTQHCTLCSAVATLHTATGGSDTLILLTKENNIQKQLRRDTGQDTGHTGWGLSVRCKTTEKKIKVFRKRNFRFLSVFFVFCLDPPRNGTLCWPSLFHPFEEAISPQCQLFFTLNDKIPSFNFNFMNPCTTNSANSKHDPFPCKSHVRLFVVVQTCVLYSLVLPPTLPITFDLLQ